MILHSFSPKRLRPFARVLSTSLIRPSLPPPHTKSIWWTPLLMSCVTGLAGYYQVHDDERYGVARWATDRVGAPSLFEKYDISDEILGEGGYGMVSKGIDKQTGEQVAIKSMSKRETSARDFWAEVDLLRIAGRHPNIMSFRDVFETDDTWFIVQELAQDGELFDELIQNGAYSEQQAATTLRELCDALHHLHRKGIVHGDIKPENILIHNHRMCLVDFGVSFRLGERDARRPFSGTVAYLPPEVLCNNEASDVYGPSVDMFALGIVMYIIMYGVHPFDPTNSLSDEAIRENILSGKVNMDFNQGQGISEDAKDLILRLLHPDPEKRITAAEALVHPWLNPSSKLSTKPLPGSAEQLRQFQRGRRRLRASILAVLLNPNRFENCTAKTSDGHDSTSRKEMEWGISSNANTASNKAAAALAAVGIFDLDNKGYISDKDLRRVGSILGRELSDSEIHEMLVAADGDPETVGSISYDDIKMAICSLRSMTFENGDVIIREGCRENDKFYFLMDGEVEVSCRNRMERHKLDATKQQSADRVVLQRLKKGSYFGDVELSKPDGVLYPRFASYRCVASACKVLALLPEDLATITSAYESIEKRVKGRASEYTNDHLVKCVEHAKGDITRRHFEKGEKICTAGEVRDSFFIIVEGKVQVIRKGIKVEELSKGDYFPLGVSGQFNQKTEQIIKRNATVSCLQPTEVIEIGGDTFRSFLSSNSFMSAYFRDHIKDRAQKRDRKQQM